jgi:hypothetical protein
MNATDQVYFHAAAEKWESIITGDLPSVATSQIGVNPRAGCTYPSIIDDLYICGVLAPIDGPGLIAGIARPTWMRVTETGAIGLPVAGEMLFDTADLQFVRNVNLIDDLVLHEMGHVIGINSGTFSEFGVQNLTATNCRYTGTLANAEYQALTGCPSVAIELTGGSGTRCTYVLDALYCNRSR